MSKNGYVAVALDPAVHHKLRGVAHYLSLTSMTRVSMSDALDQLVTTWLHYQSLPAPVVAAITGIPQPVEGGGSGNAQRKTRRAPQRVANPAPGGDSA